jgi:hypothetical protein
VLTIGGTGNLNGDYWRSDAHKWLERVPLQAAWLNARKRDDGLEWFGATELHAEHNAHKPLEEELGADWAIETGPGGNLLIHLKDKLEVLGAWSDHFPAGSPDARWVTKWNVRNPYFAETKYWLSIEHFRSGSTPQIETAKRQQARLGNAFLSTPNQIHRGIRMGDFNSWQTTPDSTPRGIMRAAGWRDLTHKCPDGSFVNRDLNTGLRWGHDGQHIDGMLTHDMVDVVYAQLWDARPLTDHSAFVMAKFDVHDKVTTA